MSNIVKIAQLLELAAQLQKCRKSIGKPISLFEAFRRICDVAQVNVTITSQDTSAEENDD